jgi:hypothetical protein
LEELELALSRWVDEGAVCDWEKQEMDRVFDIVARECRLQLLICKFGEEWGGVTRAE